MDISELTRTLKLSGVRQQYKAVVEESKHTNDDYEAFLLKLLTFEVETRKHNRISHLMRTAKFPHKLSFTEYQFPNYSRQLQSKMNVLKSLDFITNKENVILVGNPGVGKTHFATALGMEACQQGKSVLFVSVPNLIIELQEAMNKMQLTTYKRKFTKYDLIIMDELGYVSFDKKSSELLFNLISNRIGHGSIIVTTNCTFERWEDIFKDPLLTGAMIDRLAYQAHVLDMTGDSFRATHTSKWLESE